MLLKLLFLVKVTEALHNQSKLEQSQYSALLTKQTWDSRKRDYRVACTAQNFVHLASRIFWIPISLQSRWDNSAHYCISFFNIDVFLAYTQKWHFWKRKGNFVLRCSKFQFLGNTQDLDWTILMTIWPTHIRDVGVKRETSARRVRESEISARSVILERSVLKTRDWKRVLYFCLRFLRDVSDSL